MQADVLSPCPVPGCTQILAARIPTLPAAIVPMLVGSATAWSQGFVQFGPVRVTQSGLVLPDTVRNEMVLTFGAAVLVGLYLVAVGGLPILVVGLLSIAAGVLYMGGPRPLAYHGLGDLTVFLFFGFVAVMGSAYLHDASIWPAAFVDALPVGALVTAILVVNSLRDIDTDRSAGKQTLAVRLGRFGTRLEYVLLLLIAYLAPLASWLVGSPTIFWLPWLTLPLVVRLVRLVLTREGHPLYAVLAGAVRLHLLFGILISVSIAL